jgi:hypothetical protein
MVQYPEDKTMKKEYIMRGDLFCSQFRYCNSLSFLFWLFGGSISHEEMESLWKTLSEVFIGKAFKGAAVVQSTASP